MAAARIQRILCPVDFSETSRQAFAYALGLTQATGAELIVVHALEEAPLFAAYAGPQANTILAEAEKAARRELAELVADTPLPATRLRTEILRGKIPQTILEYAEQQQVDLIVMGTHGRSGLEYAFFGSVAERVIRRARCPVLIVPPGNRQR
ncbi:MAG: universal stress protein [Acidobacteriia bacterium]|jgi:universal stress protein A|nr:universal stress protein [Terriglobia bacterium]